MSQSAMVEHMQFTLDLPDRILLSAGTDSRDAFTKAVGTLAQIIHITTRDDHREEVLDAAADMLRDYVKMLDEVSGLGSAAIHAQH